MARNFNELRAQMTPERRERNRLAAETMIRGLRMPKGPRDVSAVIKLLESASTAHGQHDNGKSFVILKEYNYVEALSMLRDLDARTGRRDPTVRARDKGPRYRRVL